MKAEPMPHATTSAPSGCAPRVMRAARRALLLAAFALAPALASARVDVQIEGVKKTLEENVHAFLSVTRYAGRDDVDAQTMARLDRRIPGEVKDALEPFGYYAPTVSHQVTREGDDWKVTIHIQPGSAVRFDEVDIEFTGPGAGDKELLKLRDDSDVKPGRRLNHAAYDRKKADLLRVASNRGYLEATLAQHELLIDPQSRRAQVHLALDTGPRYAFGKLTIAQDVLRDERMQRLVRFKEGDPYSLDALLTTQYVLDDTQYFSIVSIDPGRRDQDTKTVPVTITAEPNRKHRYTASVGYGTDTKVRGKLTWDNRRVNDRGHRSQVQLTGSSVVSELAGRYIIPVRDIALEKIEFTGGWRRELLGDLISRRVGVSTGLTQVMGEWQRVLFVQVSREQTEAPDGSMTDFLVIPGISYSTLPIGALGAKPRRWTLYTELTGSPSTFGSDASYLRFRTEGERVGDFDQNWHWRLRGQLGASWVADFSELPASQRFFAGGDRSVRGFALNELSPRDADGNRVGARNLVTGTVEIERDLPRNFRAAVFYDIGNAVNNFSDPLEYSVGVGLRWRVAVISFGIDLAQPLSQSGRGPRLHLNISALY
jgi:translocation and assembly module TamA